LLGDGADGLGNPVEIGPADIAKLRTTAAAGGELWPETQLTPLELDGAPCASLAATESEHLTVLAGSSASSDGSSAQTDSAISVHVPDGGGALVRAGTTGSLTLIDPTGTSYSVPGSIEVGTQRLGYSASDVTTVPAAWLQLLPAGPELTPEAAGSTPTGQ
jgi:hypothetical protein